MIELYKNRSINCRFFMNDMYIVILNLIRNERPTASSQYAFCYVYIMCFLITESFICIFIMCVSVLT